MKESEILEGNKLIAEFMGYKLITPEMRRNPEEWYIDGKPSCYWENHSLKGSKKVLCSEDSLKYHSSWDWLMPCIGKISSLIDKGIYKNMLIMNLTVFATLEDTYKSVIEYIKWYNEQTKK